MHIRVVPFVACIAILGSVALLGQATGRQNSVGPHDALHAELDVAEYWLPRNRAEISRRGLSPNDVRRAEARARPFDVPTRVSDDLLESPPASLATAQAETQTEPYLAVNPEDPDNVLAGWQETRFTDGGARALGFATSRDRGKTWTEGRIPGLTTVDGGIWDRASDPWPAFGPDGVAYFGSLLVMNTGVGGTNAMAVSRSGDGGLTWNSPVEVFRSDADFNDKNSLVVDISGSKHRGNVYVAWDINVAGASGFTGQRMVVARSTDGGKSYQKPRRLTAGFTNIGIIPRVGRDGTVYAIWSSAASADPNLSIVFSKSTNGGQKWSKPVKIADLLAAGVAGFRSGAILPSFDIDPNDDTLYVAWPDARFSGVDQAAIIVSRDGGDTWSEPAKVNDTPAGSPIFTVGVAANAAGEAAVGYYSNHRGSAASSTDYYVNVSADSGTSFGTGLRVTRKSFNANFAAKAGSQTLSIFLGDYVGLAGAGDGFFALYAGTHARSRLNDSRQADIFAARSR